MKGIEIARAYWAQYGRPMLEKQFPDLLPLVAAGLTGGGSECYGYDDDVSADHDFEPGFTLFLPGEDVVDRRRAFLLERAYDKLPREFMGLRRGLMAPVGGPRRGVVRIGEYYRDKVGAPDGVLTLGQWLSLPEHALSEAVNGEIFYDGCGEVTRIRAGLSHYPGDVRKKKLAGRLLLMGQSGQYNYARCLRHGETGAAQLAAVEFAQSAMHAVFLLNDVYMPYYKWQFRAMRGLERLSLLAEVLEYLITTGNDDNLAGEKQAVMEGVAGDVIRELRAQGLTAADCGDLEKHAYSVNDSISDGQLRNLHVLAAV